MALASKGRISGVRNLAPIFSDADTRAQILTLSVRLYFDDIFQITENVFEFGNSYQVDQLEPCSPIEADFSISCEDIQYPNKKTQLKENCTDLLTKGSFEPCDPAVPITASLFHQLLYLFQIRWVAR